MSEEELRDMYFNHPEDWQMAAGRPLNKRFRSEGRYPDGYLRFRLVDEDDNVLEDYDTQEQVEMRMSLHEGTYLSDAEDVA
jgi:hypothetical protein